jgi:hypothetical protein
MLARSIHNQSPRRARRIYDPETKTVVYVSYRSANPSHPNGHQDWSCPSVRVRFHAVEKPSVKMTVPMAYYIADLCHRSVRAFAASFSQALTLTLTRAARQHAAEQGRRRQQVALQDHHLRRARRRGGGRQVAAVKEGGGVGAGGGGVCPDRSALPARLPIAVTTVRGPLRPPGRSRVLTLVGQRMRSVARVEAARSGPGGLCSLARRGPRGPLRPPGRTRRDSRASKLGRGGGPGGLCSLAGPANARSFSAASARPELGIGINAPEPPTPPGRPLHATPTPRLAAGGTGGGQARSPNIPRLRRRRVGSHGHS